MNFSGSIFLSAQTFLKAKIQDNITKYFMLIVFSAYIGLVDHSIQKMVVMIIWDQTKNEER